MAASLGEQLRLAREARHISLREISDQTRISIRFLEAIELDDYRRLPGGIFNRSFVKAYARHVGFDEKEAVEVYIQTAKERGHPDENPQTEFTQPKVFIDGTPTRSPLVTVLLTVLVLAILSLGVWALMHWYQRRADSGPNEVTRNSSAVPIAQPSQQSDITTQSKIQTATKGFVVRIRAIGEKAWVKAIPNDSDAFEKILDPDESKEFTPTQSIKIMCARVKINALEITINNRRVKIPEDQKGGIIQFVINRDDYEKLLQQ